MTHIHFDLTGQLVNKPEWEKFRNIVDLGKYGQDLVANHGDEMVRDYTPEHMVTYELLTTTLEQVYDICIALVKKVGIKNFDYVFVTKYDGDERRTYRMVFHQDTNALEMYEV